MEQQELQILPVTTPGKDEIPHAGQREGIEQDVSMVEERRKRSKVRLIAIITALFVCLTFPCSSPFLSNYTTFPSRKQKKERKEGNP